MLIMLMNCKSHLTHPLCVTPSSLSSLLPQMVAAACTGPVLSALKVEAVTSRYSAREHAVPSNYSPRAGSAS